MSSDAASNKLLAFHSTVLLFLFLHSYTIEKSVLEELVKRDSLNVREVELFKAVDCWAKKECKKQGLAAEGFVKRRILGERIVKAIRFPVMEQHPTYLIEQFGNRTQSNTNRLIAELNRT